MQVVRADGKGQKTIAWTGIDPRQIAVDPINGFFYFVDCFEEKRMKTCEIRV